MKKSSESLDEPTEPAASQFKRIVIVCLAMIFMVIVLWGGIGNILRPFNKQAQNAAKFENQRQLFFAAIENQMRAPFVAQKGSQVLGSSAENKDTLRMEATSDFSNPSAPKTTLDYKVESADAAANNASRARNLTVIGTELYVMLPEGVTAASDKYTSGQWYHTQLGSDAQKILDPPGVGSEVNTSLGLVLTGQFSDQQRREYMKYITDNNVYSIKKTNSERLDSKDVTRYEVTINTTKIKELNKRVAEQLSVRDVIGTAPEGAAAIEKFNAWVSNNDKKFQKIVFELKNPKSGETSESTFTFEYLKASPNIAAPEGFVEAE